MQETGADVKTDVLDQLPVRASCLWCDICFLSPYEACVLNSPISPPFGSLEHYSIGSGLLYRKRLMM